MSDDALALAFRTGHSYVGLRNYEPDAELDRVIPPDAARAARVIPLAADADHLRLAVTDPEADLTALDRYLDGRRLDLAIAPADELDAILGPPPAEPAAAPRAQASVRDAVLEAELISAHVEPLEADAEMAAFADATFAAEPPQVAAPAAEPEAERVEEPVAEPEAEAVEAEPRAEPEAAAVAEAEPAVEPSVDAEPAAAEPPEPVAAVAAPPGETPSWLEPRRRGKQILTALYVLVMALIVAGGAVAAYLLTR